MSLAEAEKEDLVEVSDEEISPEETEGLETTGTPIDAVEETVAPWALPEDFDGENFDAIDEQYREIVSQVGQWYSKRRGETQAEYDERIASLQGEVDFNRNLWMEVQASKDPDGFKQWQEETATAKRDRENAVKRADEAEAALKAYEEYAEEHFKVSTEREIKWLQAQYLDLIEADAQVSAAQHTGEGDIPDGPQLQLAKLLNAHFEVDIGESLDIAFGYGVVAAADFAELVDQGMPKNKALEWMKSRYKRQHTNPYEDGIVKPTEHHRGAPAPAPVAAKPEPAPAAPKRPVVSKAAILADDDQPDSLSGPETISKKKKYETYDDALNDVAGAFFKRLGR